MCLRDCRVVYWQQELAKMVGWSPKPDAGRADMERDGVSTPLQQQYYRSTLEVSTKK